MKSRRLDNEMRRHGIARVTLAYRAGLDAMSQEAARDGDHSLAEIHDNYSKTIREAKAQHYRDIKVLEAKRAEKNIVIEEI